MSIILENLEGDHTLEEEIKGGRWATARRRGADRSRFQALYSGL